MEGAGPHVCTHNTDAGLDQEDNSPFQDAAQAGSPSLLGRGGGKHLGVFLHFSLQNRRMKMGSIPIAFLCHLLFLPGLPARPQGHLQGQAWTRAALFNWSSCSFCISAALPLLWCWGQCRILNQLLPLPAQGASGSDPISVIWNSLSPHLMRYCPYYTSKRGRDSVLPRTRGLDPGGGGLSGECWLRPLASPDSRTLS